MHDIENEERSCHPKNVSSQGRKGRKTRSLRYGASTHPGARKLKAKLEQLDPSVDWPAVSTFANILKRAGLTSPKRKKRRTTLYSEPFSGVTAPNQLWCMDFKGYFSTGDLADESYRRSREGIAGPGRVLHAA